MLKALELTGFKSFADKTRFEFDRGITAIVGPNGSGKSNVVDAIKWVLGEQSAKSLRGREMADCIFNGSGTRRSQGMAEVTLIFDNRAGLLPLETEEVAITRRVYRTGEGEYLINRQGARLRDIRELFLGTGAATEAYSVIEQGKVDVLLQASTKERRLIFEEAAGISRFRVKKAEALRKLDVARQNLLRVDDVLEEVQRQLRSVRQQSARARRYKEYSSRLRELRLALALVDYRSMQADLDASRDAAEQLERQQSELAERVESLEVESQRGEAILSELEQRRLGAETRWADHERRIDACHSTIDHQRQRSDEWQAELGRHREQWSELLRSSGELVRRHGALKEQREHIETEHAHRAAEVSKCEAELTELAQAAAQQHREVEQQRERLMDLMRRSSALSNERAGFEARQNSLQVGRDRLAQRLAQSEKRLEQLETQWQRLEQAREQIAVRLSDHRRQLEACLSRRASLSEAREQIVASHHALAQRRSAAMERASVLRDLQNRQEGLSQGVKQALAWRRRPEPGIWAQLQGVVADLLEVDLEHARLIEVALGPRSAYLVFGPQREPLDLLIEISKELKGRAGVVVLGDDDVPPVQFDTETAQPAPEHPGRQFAPAPAPDRSGEVRRADRLVRAKEGCRALAEQLLSDTLVVPDLATALRLRAHNAAGSRWVTLNGELVRTDGTVEVGPAHTTGGLISRNSELRALEEQIGRLEAEIETVEEDLRRNQSQLAECDAAQQLLQQHVEGDREALSRQQASLEHAGQQLDQLRRERDITASELDQVEEEYSEAVQASQEASRNLAQLDEQVGSQNEAIASTEQQLAQADEQRQEVQRRVTAAKVEWAQSNERLQALEQEVRQIEGQQRQREQTLVQLRRDIAEYRQRIDQSCREILRAESQLASLYLAKEELGRLTAELVDRQHQQRRQRDELLRDLAELRRQVHDVEQQRHGEELHLSELKQRVETLAGRMREDYEVELADLAASDGHDAETATTTEGSDEAADPGDADNAEADATAEQETAAPETVASYALPEDRSREEVEAEIEQLRRKLAGLGAVNLEALRELEDLETRSGVLTHQREDLVRASAAQEEILRKISAESRKLFAATLDAVRGHFEELFRKLFGGGRADIVLEDEEDILESGIEIIARPPGKEPRSISQLSGGEKTLTAVAILLAIFRSRPSPFCVLDEVDAALDEGNVDRFVVVLNEFLSWTQFILITHCKRTMTCAGVLYGITMQESGVSKRVAVRFEDVSEDGRFEVREGAEETVPQAGGNGQDESEEQDTEGPPFVQQGGPHWNRTGTAQPEQATVDESEPAE